MLGNILDSQGRLIYNKDLMLVHIKLKSGEKIPSHDHKGQDVFFTPVDGELKITLDEKEEHIIKVGQVLNFAGEYSISVDAITDAEFFVYLINRR